jgi:hypothetical protein
VTLEEGRSRFRKPCAKCMLLKKLRFSSARRCALRDFCACRVLYLCSAQLLIGRLKIAQPSQPIRPRAISSKPIPRTGSGRTANTATAVARTRAAQKLQGALEPVDRPQEVPLAQRHAAMTQNVVRRRYKEEEIRKGELLQIIVAL